MKQFILPDAPDENGVIRLKGDDFHYLARVRRMREGDTAGCRLPSGKPAEMKIKSVGEGILLAECKPKDGESHPKNRLPPIILFQSILKGTKMDAVVRQAGETGIKEIVPFYSERSVPRPACGERSPQARTGRWQRILRTAQQQSGSETPAGVACPCSADYLFDYWTRIRDHSQKALALLIHEVPLEKGSFHEYLDSTPDLIVMAVGPEGGFSPAEADDFIEAGFKPVTLGDTVLRAENAALYAAAAVRTLIFERHTWTVKANQ